MTTAVGAPVMAVLGGRSATRQRRRRSEGFLDVERSALHRALDEGRFQSVMYQVRLGMDPNVRSRQGLTPLMRCARVRPLGTSLQLIRTLLERGANPDQTDDRGSNLLQLAVREGNAALARLLLTENNVNFHHRDSDGDTVLHLLAGQSLELCRLVLRSARRFHIDCDIGNADGLTPMMAACRAGNLPVAELLATLGGASFTKRDPRYRRTAQDWLLASVGPGGMSLKLEQLRRGDAGGREDANADPYESIRQSRRLETLTRLFQTRHSLTSQQVPHQPEHLDAAPQQEGQHADDAEDEAQDSQHQHQQQNAERPGTAAVTCASVAGDSVISQQLHAAASAASRRGGRGGGHARLLSGVFDVYELQMSASFRRTAVPLPQAAAPDVPGGLDDSTNRSGGSRPLSRVSSGRSQRSPVPQLGVPAFPGAAGGAGPRRMTEFAGLRLKQRIRSGVRMSETGQGAASDASSSQLLNTSQESGGLRRLSSRN